MAEVIDIASLPLSGTASRVFDDMATVSFFLIDLGPGDGPPLHVHPYEEIFIVQQGTAAFSVGDESVEVSAGQIVIGPAHVPHTFVNSGDTQLHTVNIHPSPRMITEWL